MDQHFQKPHWHLTKEEAIVQIKKMIAAKRKIIKKQLKKLDELEASFGGEQ